MKRIVAILSIVLMLAFVVTQAHADSLISSLSNDTNPNIAPTLGCCGDTFWNLIGICFPVTQTFSVTRLAVSLAKQDTGGLTGTLNSELFSTTGNAGAGTCSSGASSSPIATSTNTVTIESL